MSTATKRDILSHTTMLSEPLPVSSVFVPKPNQRYGQHVLQMINFTTFTVHFKGHNGQIKAFI